jgi:predicted RNA-binding Zn ribbon-like protein
VNESEKVLLDVLNSAPVVAGRIVETLDDPETVRLRDELHAVIRGEAEPAVLARHLTGVRRRPVITNDGVDWVLEAPEGEQGRVELVLAWARIQKELPGRLRPCANPECSKFLIDHSRPNSARWCSMAGCGNRMKARRHYARRSD